MHSVFESFTVGSWIDGLEQPLKRADNTLTFFMDASQVDRLAIVSRPRVHKVCDLLFDAWRKMRPLGPTLSLPISSIDHVSLQLRTEQFSGILKLVLYCKSCTCVRCYQPVGWLLNDLWQTLWTSHKPTIHISPSVFGVYFSREAHWTVRCSHEQYWEPQEVQHLRLRWLVKGFLEGLYEHGVFEVDEYVDELERRGELQASTLTIQEQRDSVKQAVIMLTNKDHGTVAEEAS